MSLLMAVVDGEPVIEYDRDKVLPDNQLEYLNKMDEKMEMGIEEKMGKGGENAGKIGGNDSGVENAAGIRAKSGARG